MQVEIKHYDGVGANSIYYIMFGDEYRASIRMMSRHYSRRWSVVDRYHEIVKTFDSKGDAVGWVEANPDKVPTIEQAHEAKWHKVYEQRKRDAIKHLAERLAKCVIDIAEGSNSAHAEAGEIAALIESAARGKTDLPYTTYADPTAPDAGRSYTYSAVHGNFPNAPDDLRAEDARKRKVAA